MLNIHDKESIYNRLKKINFSCTRCSNCCRHEPGAVFLTKSDVKAISSHLQMDTLTFLKKCCRPVERSGSMIASLLEKVNYDCLFWNNGCIIYEDRPMQCRTYPYWPMIVESNLVLESEKGRCPGIGRESSFTLDERYEMLVTEMNADYFELDSTSIREIWKSDS
jgi:hypothetical protein